MAPRTRGPAEPRKEVDDGRPTVADLQGESPFAQLAKKHWLKPGKKSAKVKIKPQVLKKEIWDVLEQEGFSYKTLLVLENLQILERYAQQELLRLAHTNYTAATYGQGFQMMHPTIMCS